MRVRCKAVADPRSNALGSLELESTPAGLWIAYQSMRSYREGYAPGPAAVAAEHRVPWQAVRAARVGAERLRLEVQEPLSPFAHFYLRDFARADPLPWIARAKPWAQLSSPQVVLTEFCHELSARLASPVANEMTLQPELGPPRALLRFPRAGVALCIVLLSCVLAAFMLGKAQTFSVPTLEPAVEAPLQQVTPATPAGAPLVRALARAQPESSPDTTADTTAEAAEPPALAPPTLGAGCECIRHESVLWERPPPRLSALVIERRLEPHGSHQHLALEIALVNNGDHALGNFSLSVRLAGPKPGPPGTDEAPVERTLYVPGPLAPGHQLRWKARGRGDRFELRAPDLGRLDEDGIDAAPADAFLELANTSNGMVRLHAGMMLAFLGDARARGTLLQLAPGSSASESAYLSRLQDSTADLRVCQLRVSESGTATRIQSCLYNATDATQTDFELKVRSLGPMPDPENPTSPPPALLAEEMLAWSGTLAPHRGRRLELSLDLSRGKPSGDRRIELIAHQKETR